MLVIQDGTDINLDHDLCCKFTYQKKNDLCCKFVFI